MNKITRERLTEYLQGVVRVLSENGGVLSSRDVIRELEKRLNPSDFEKGVFERSGGVRWIKSMQFHSIALVKAGWIQKNKGVWYLTPDGEKTLEFDSKKFREEVDKKYKEWLLSRNIAPAIRIEDMIEDMTQTIRSRSYEQAVEDAREEIKKYLHKLNPYEFQDLIAALFRGMGYYTPFIAPRGPDGGIDIVAYRDPIGAELPRIRVQVKHRPDQKIGRPEVQGLGGNLHREGYIGILVSSGGFTADALTEIRSSGKHIEKIDLDDLIDLWERNYEKLVDEDKQLLPLRRISFLAPEE